MGLPVTVYRWDDAGAPALDGKPSSLIAVLKACLVNGYGSKQPLGWTAPFEDASTQKIVFRNSTTDGSGGFFQVESKSGSDNMNDHMLFNAAKAMAGIGQFTLKSQQRAVALYTYETQWVLIGTSAGFYFQPIDNRYSATSNRAASYCQCTFVGDLHSFHSNDSGRFTVINGDLTGDDSTGSPGDSISELIENKSLNLIYDLDGFDNSIIGRLFMIPAGVSSQGLGSPESRGVDVLTYEAIVTAGINVNAYDRNSVKLYDSLVQPFIRAKLPGFVITSTNGYYDEPWGVIRNDTGVDHFGMVNYLGIQVWVNMGQWYE